MFKKFSVWAKYIWLALFSKARKDNSNDNGTGVYMSDWLKS
jgi:hypothetical protein